MLTGSYTIVIHWQLLPHFFVKSSKQPTFYCLAGLQPWQRRRKLPFRSYRQFCTFCWLLFRYKYDNIPVHQWLICSSLLYYGRALSHRQTCRCLHHHFRPWALSTSEIVRRTLIRILFVDPSSEWVFRTLKIFSSSALFFFLFSCPCFGNLRALIPSSALSNIRDQNKFRLLQFIEQMSKIELGVHYYLDFL